jgi:outer membrane protein assembly factor BamB
MLERSIDPAFPADLTKGDGVVTAIAARSGRKLWTQPLGSPATGCTTVAGDVVFAPTLDGRLYAFRAKDGLLLWQTRASAGINGCPSVGDGVLLVGAGAPLPGGTAVPTLTAYEVDGYGK